MTDYNDGKWHSFDDYTGGVHEKSIVNIIYDNGYFYDTEMEYAKLIWTRFVGVTESGGCKTISETPVAFRVIHEHKEPPKPREFWICPEDEGIYSCDPKTYGYIHVREVLE